MYLSKEREKGEASVDLAKVRDEEKGKRKVELFGVYLQRTGPALVIS